MEAVIMGIALSFNILIILWKLEHHRGWDALLDASLLGLIMWMSGGSMGGMLVGTVASAIVSIYLLINRPDQLITNSKPKQKPKDMFTYYWKTML